MVTTIKDENLTNMASIGTVIKVENLTKKFSIRKEVLAIDNLNLIVKKGEILGIIGPNGAGKTTLIKILVDLLEPTEGNVEIFGKKLGDIKIKQQISYSGQDTENSGYWRMTVEENLYFFLVYIYKINSNEAKKRIKEAFQKLGSTELLNKYFSTLSGGQKQLMVCLRSLLVYPKIVFLDEPTKSLDPITYKNFISFLLEIIKEYSMTVILTTHRMNEVQDLCTRVVVLDRGKILFDGEVLEIRNLFQKHRIIQISSKSLPNEIITKIQGLPGYLNMNHEKVYKFVFNDPFISLPKVAEILIDNNLRVPIGIPLPSLEDALEYLVLRK